MSGLKLYDIPLEFAELESALVETEGELTPELEQRINDFLRAGKDKIEAAAMVVRTLEMSAETCANEAKKLQDKAASHTRNADRLKKLVLIAIDSAFQGKIKTPLFTIWGQTSTASISFDLAPEIDLKDMEITNPDFVRVKRELAKDALKKAYTEQREIPDSIIVTVTPGTRYLRIK